MASSNPGRYSDTRATETSPLLRRRESSKQAVGSGGDEVLKSDLSDVDVVAGARQNVGYCGENDENISLSNINPRRRLMWAMPSLVLGVFLSAADQTIVVSTYGKIGSELQALSTSSWIATGYFLTLTSFQPLYGRLSEIFGRKPAFLFSFAVFGLGCLFCGLARTMRELIAARAFAGIGGGGMTTVVAILLSDVIPLRDRGTWQGYFNIVFAAGAGLGGPLGGVLADHIGWRWCFLIQVPLTIAALINVHYALESPAEDLSNLKRKLQRIDFAGALTLIAAVLTLLLGLDLGSNVSWHSPLSYGSLTASFLFFGLFVLAETRFASEPFAPGHVIFERSILACLLCNLFSFGGWVAITYYLPLYWQAVKNLSATQAGLRLLPGIVGSVSGSLFAGLVVKQTGRYRSLIVTCYTILITGVVPIILFTVPGRNCLWAIWLGTFVCGFTNGVGGTGALVALISVAAPKDQSVAIACLYLFRSLGMAVGISLAATVFQQSLQTSLRAALQSNSDAEAIVTHVRQDLYYINTLKPAVQRLVRKCFAVATTDSFTLDLGIVAVAFVASLFIMERKLAR